LHVGVRGTIEARSWHVDHHDRPFFLFVGMLNVVMVSCNPSARPHPVLRGCIGGPNMIGLAPPVLSMWNVLVRSAAAAAAAAAAARSAVTRPAMVASPTPTRTPSPLRATIFGTARMRYMETDGRFGTRTKRAQRVRRLWPDLSTARRISAVWAAWRMQKSTLVFVGTTGEGTRDPTGMYASEPES
jgi:hypothetical protein